MENLNLGEKEDPKKTSSTSKVSNFVKAALLSKLLDNSKMDTTLADNLYANRILEEELIAPDKSYSGLTPSLPEGTKIIDINGSHYAHIGDKMYYIREFKGGFDLVDDTKDFIPDKHLSSGEYKRRAALQKKCGLSATTEVIPQKEFYRYNESISDLDDWIIHNDKGKIRKDKSGKDSTWWRKGEPYKAMEKRSMLDRPEGRHLFAKQSALEASIGRPLDQHRELIGDIIKKGDIKNGDITMTPTSEADLPNIEGLKSLTYNPITKSMEKGIFYNPNKPKDEKDQHEKLKGHRDIEK
ncbi:MAG TPA: hypothetical protein VFQ59_00660 [Candidatus Paceibacterota bacterium]|nr:hypothetical protein [Candidatus Paceibacterota bacterium]